MNQTKKRLYTAGWYVLECLLLLMPPLATNMIPGVVGKIMAVTSVIIIGSINVRLRFGRKYRHLDHKDWITAFIVANGIQLIMFSDFLYQSI